MVAQRDPGVLHLQALISRKARCHQRCELGTPRNHAAGPGSIMDHGVKGSLCQDDLRCSVHAHVLRSLDGVNLYW